MINEIEQDFGQMVPLAQNCLRVAKVTQSEDIRKTVEGLMRGLKCAIDHCTKSLENCEKWGKDDFDKAESIRRNRERQVFENIYAHSELHKKSASIIQELIRRFVLNEESPDTVTRDALALITNRTKNNVGNVLLTTLPKINEIPEIEYALQRRQVSKKSREFEFWLTKKKGNISS